MTCQYVIFCNVQMTETSMRKFEDARKTQNIFLIKVIQVETAAPVLNLIGFSVTAKSTKDKISKKQLNMFFFFLFLLMEGIYVKEYFFVTCL